MMEGVEEEGERDEMMVGGREKKRKEVWRLR